MLVLLVVGVALAAPHHPRAAARWLDRHPDRAEAAVERWLTDPDAAALAQVVAERLDTLPEPLAVQAATVGVRGPHAALVEPAVWADPRPTVRAVLALEAPPDVPGGA